MIKKSILCFAFIIVGFSSKSQDIYTVAGNGSPTYSGDGGTAVLAGFQPHDIKMDDAGNIYFPDRPNARIRKIDKYGIISTVSTAVTSPNSIALDKTGNIYVADGGAIKKIDTSGVMTIAATGVSNPYGVSVDTFRNWILIADSYNNVVKKVDSLGIITVIAGNGIVGFSGDGGLAINAQLSWPSHAIADRWGNIYICDASNNRIRKIDTLGIITTIAGVGPTSTSPGVYIGSYAGDGGPAAAANFNLPFRIILDSSGANMYVADNGNHCIRRIDADGIVSLVAGDDTLGFSGDGGPAVHAKMGEPNGVAFDHNGNLFIADWNNARIRKVSSVGTDGVKPTSIVSNIGIDVYPNPNQGTFTLNVFSSDRETAIINITNVLGETVQKTAVTTNIKTNIKLEVSSGIYFLTAITQHGKQSSRVEVW